MPPTPARCPRIRRAAILAALTAAVTAPAATGIDLERVPGPNGPVYAITPPDGAGNRYVGGDFTAFDQYRTGGFLTGHAATGAFLLARKRVTGTVTDMVADGAGGLYIAGDFTCLGPNTSGACDGPEDLGRGGLAHFDSSGEPDTWAPTTNGTVTAIARFGSTVYIGGSFTTVNGAARARVAAVGTSGTGTLTAWTTTSVAAGATPTEMVPDPTGAVLYVGATAASGSRLLGLDTTTGATTWDAGTNGDVSAVGVQSGHLYAAGDFTSITAGARRHAASWDVSSPAAPVATAWNPLPDGPVRGLGFGTNRLYLGGDFTCLDAGTASADTCLDTGEHPRAYAAAYDTTTPATPALQAWDPRPDGPVEDLLEANSRVYLTGAFECINTPADGACGDEGSRVSLNAAAVDPGTGIDQGWIPTLNGPGLVLGELGTEVAAGGRFDLAGGPATLRLTAIGDTGTQGWFSMPTDGAVRALALDGNVLYAAGDFTATGGAPRSRAAAFATSFPGTLNAWNPAPNGQVRALAVNGSTVYLGGAFTCVGGDGDGTCGEAGEATRNRAAAVDATAGTAGAWDPDLDGTVNAIAVNAGVAYLGGTFTTVNGATPQGRAAAVDAGTGSHLPAWNPAPNGAVNALVADGDTVRVGGAFTTIGGEGRGRLAAVDAVTGAAGAWNPALDGTVRALRIARGAVWAAGDFTHSGATVRNGAAAFSRTSGTLTDWDPDLTGGSIDAISPATADTTMAVGGAFTTAAGTPTPNLAFGTATSPPAAPSALAAVPGDGRVTITFTSGTGDAATNLDFSLDDGTTWTTRSPAGAAGPLTITGLANGVTHTIRLRGRNAGGAGEPSASIAVTPAAAPPPPPGGADPGAGDPGAGSPPPDEDPAAATPIGTPVLSAGGRVVTLRVRLDVAGTFTITLTRADGAGRVRLAAGTVVDGWATTAPAGAATVHNWQTGRTITIRARVAGTPLAAAPVVTATAEDPPAPRPPATVVAGPDARGATVRVAVRLARTGRWSLVFTDARTGRPLTMRAGTRAGRLTLAAPAQAVRLPGRAGTVIRVTARLARAPRPGSAVAWAVAHSPGRQDTRVRLGG